MSDVTTFTQVAESRPWGYGYTPDRWACDVCGRTGIYDPHKERQWPSTYWFTACKRGHSPCPWCGKQLALRLDGTPRVHARCKERPDDAELLRLVAQEVRDVARLGVRGPMTSAHEQMLERLTTAGSSDASE